MPQVAIVTDSTSDLDAAAAARSGIIVVPLFVNFGDTRYVDGVDMNRDEFYHRLKTDPRLPTTTQPTAKMFEDAFAPLVAQGRPIVGTFISQQMSGTINAARAAAEQFKGHPIALFDSLTCTAGLALQAAHAAELARAGASVDDILAALALDRDNQHGYAAIPDLSQAVRTGRIGKAKAAIGGLLKIVPVIRMSTGMVEEEARVRTFPRAQEGMILSTLRTIGDVAKARIQVIHSRDPELAKSVVARLRAQLPGEPLTLTVSEAGPVIAVHTGQGAVGIFSISGY
jgi:DegV family protein with EDD domain